MSINPLNVKRNVTSLPVLSAGWHGSCAGRGQDRTELNRRRLKNERHLHNQTRAAAAVELEAFEARAREMTGAVKATMMIAAAPLLGLAFVVLAPIAGLAVLAWMLMKALVRNRVATRHPRETRRALLRRPGHGALLHRRLPVRRDGNAGLHRDQGSAQLTPIRVWQGGTARHRAVLFCLPRSTPRSGARRPRLHHAPGAKRRDVRSYTAPFARSAAISPPCSPGPPGSSSVCSPWSGVGWSFSGCG